MTPAPAAGADLTDGSLAEAEQGWFVYAVVDAGAEVPADLLGVDDQAVGTVVAGRVAAVVSPIGLARPPARGADLRAFHRVVDTLSDALETVAPVRFGSVLVDRPSVAEEFLGPQEAWLAGLLDELRGRVQMTVQARYDQETVLREVVAAEPEVAALRARTRDLPEDAARGDRMRLGELVAAAVEQRRAHDSATLLDDLVPLAIAHAVRPVSGLERVLDVALLVEVARRDELETRLEVLAEEVHDRMRLRLVGPTAPYDFAGGA